MLLILDIVAIFAIDVTKNYKVTSPEYPGLYMMLGDDNILKVGDKMAKVTFATSDEGRYNMFVDGTKVCRKGTKMYGCPPNVKDDWLSKVFLKKRSGNSYKIEWGVLNKIVKAFDSGCLNVFESKIIEMKRCYDHKANQNWDIEEIEEKKPEPEKKPEELDKKDDPPQEDSPKEEPNNPPQDNSPKEEPSTPPKDDSNMPPKDDSNKPPMDNPNNSPANNSKPEANEPKNNDNQTPNAKSTPDSTEPKPNNGNSNPGGSNNKPMPNARQSPVPNNQGPNKCTPKTNLVPNKGLNPPGSKRESPYDFNCTKIEDGLEIVINCDKIKDPCDNSPFSDPGNAKLVGNKIVKKPGHPHHCVRNRHSPSACLK